MHQYRIQTVSHAKGVVLEIGFGTGQNLKHYPKEGIEKLYALEPSEKLFERAKEKIQYVTFPVDVIVGSAELIPLPDASVDAVVSTMTMCSVQNPERVLQEIYRVLKPGGMFLFTEHGISPHSHVKILQHLANPVSKLVAGGCHLIRDIGKLIQNSHLTVEAITTAPMKKKPLAYMYIGRAKKSV